MALFVEWYLFALGIRLISTTPENPVASESPIKASKLDQGKASRDARSPAIPAEYRYIYPEFLPDPKLEFRNSIREKLERLDMLNRR